jgi:hypothetical protein
MFLVRAMKLSQLQGNLKRFRRTPWRFQQTFQTPLKKLKPFVATIFSSLEPLSGACLTIDQVVFEPKHLINLLAGHSLPPQYGHEWSITADCKTETEELLEAALGDWVDFVFIPVPKPFVIYADHDEYITFYANTKSNLNRVAQALTTAGFDSVPDYERRL